MRYDKNIKNTSLPLLFLLLLSSSLLFSQNWPVSYYTIGFFGNEDGLPQSSVTSIVQTKEGYLWFGTYEGLARFDGISFDIFDDSNTPEFYNNGIKALLADSKGDLWIGTPNGLLLYKNHKFKHFGTNDGLSGDFILSLYEDSKGIVWIGTTTGLNKYENGKFINMTPANPIFTSYIYAITGDSLGRIWIGSSSYGLNYIEGLSFRHFGPEHGVEPMNVRSLLVDKRGKIWMGTPGEGIWVQTDDSKIRFKKKNDIPATDIRVLYSDEMGRIWIGTNNNDLLILENGKLLSPLKYTPYAGLAIRSILKDRDGSFWVGTRTGLLRFKKNIYVLFNSSNGFPTNQVRSIFKSRDNDLWFGTVGGGLVRKHKDEIKTVLSNRQIKGGKVWSISQSGDGAIWAGTYGDGVYRYKNGKWRRYSKKNGLADNVIRAVFVDSKDRIWLGTNGRGINVIDHGKILHFSTENGLADDYIFSFAEDKDGNIWIGSYSGELTSYTGKEFFIYSPEKLSERHAIWTIYPDSSDGSLWLGTDYGGLKRFYEEKFTAFTTKDGLYHNSAFQILEDSSGYFWMNCNKGIYRVKKRDILAYSRGEIEKISYSSFGKEEGIIITESSGPAEPAGCIDGQGKIWFATIGGAVMIDPNRLNINTTPPTIVIEKLITQNNKYIPGAYIELSETEKNIEIKYTGLSFNLPKKIKFKYFLEGYDDDWVDAGNRRSAFYTGLPGGNYTFYVKAANESGIWCEEPAVLRFSIEHGIFERGWIRVFFVIMALFFFGLAHRMRMKKISLNRINLEHEVNNRTKELDIKNKELEKINRTLQKTNRKLEFLAQNDGLTHIANRRFFVDVYEREFKLAMRTKQHLSTIMIDIDNFKKFNDNYGHLKGDECLKDVARTLKHELWRPTDLVARFGGEEFIVILPNTEKEGAILTAERLRKAIFDLKIPHEFSGVEKWVTISLGVSSYVPDKNSRINTLVKRADDALYLAKERGKNRVEFLPVEEGETGSKKKKKKKE
jgi:diguanylate cyclase (GGDEF)-like protein